MKYFYWWNTILKRCGDLKILDQASARCNHPENKKYWCDFQHCPKIPPNDRKREY